jgi:hypothetical protein
MGGVRRVIVETIITTLDEAGVLNIAPMGVEWDEREIVVKPFLETTTFRNLAATRQAVVHLIDDVLLFARAAVATAEAPTEPARVVRGMVLRDTCSWRELQVRSIDATPPRSRIVADVVHRELRREFIGFNRARHAVLEAAILATRTHLLPTEEIQREIARLRVIVDKTAGPREQEAMSFLESFLQKVLPLPVTG